MADTFTLKVIASDKEFFSGKAQYLTVTTTDGVYSFMGGHQEIIMAVVPGELMIRDEKGEEIRVVSGFGTLVFANNRATVLVDTCETQEELDERRAREAMERAKERLRQKQSIGEYRMTQAALARALSRLKFKGKEIH